MNFFYDRKHNDGNKKNVFYGQLEMRTAVFCVADAHMYCSLRFLSDLPFLPVYTGFLPDCIIF